MGKGSPRTARRLGLLAVAAALGVALAAAGRRLATGSGSGSGPPRDEEYTCDCGAQYRVTGVDRHRVYWRDGEAVLGDRCPACDAPLPAGHDAPVL